MHTLKTTPYTIQTTYITYYYYYFPSFLAFFLALLNVYMKYEGRTAETFRSLFRNESEDFILS